MPDPFIIDPGIARPDAGRFIQGRGRYLDDISVTGMLHVCFVRSPYAHAKIAGIDASRALELSGVSHVFTGAGPGGCLPTLDCAADQPG